MRGRGEQMSARGDEAEIIWSNRALKEFDYGPDVVTFIGLFGTMVRLWGEWDVTYLYLYGYGKTGNVRIVTAITTAAESDEFRLTRP